MKRLGHLRAQRGWTQLELAVEADVTPTQISRLETGAVRDPNAATLRCLADALDWPRHRAAALLDDLPDVPEDTPQTAA